MSAQPRELSIEEARRAASDNWGEEYDYAQFARELERRGWTFNPGSEWARWITGEGKPEP